MLKRLFTTVQAGRDDDVDVLLRRIVEEERKRGHVRVAEDLDRILKKERTKPAPSKGPNQSLTPLPVSQRDSSPLVHEIPHEQLRHHVVLPNLVEKRFSRIEQEFAAKSRLEKSGLRPRQRILLYGPPGCGKSLGAERLAWNTGLPLRKARFDTLLSSYFGETLANLRRIFEDAEKSPCALFLDECDTLARCRMERNDVGEINRITNALLEMLENYRGQGLVIAATNLDTALDAALFRRFDEVLKIPLPSPAEIAKLLNSSLSAIKTKPTIDWKALAQRMDGMSCSEVVQVAENAAKDCVLQGRKVVTLGGLSSALEESLERNHS